MVNNMKILSSKQVQELEKITISELGINSLVLMERAALETYYFIKNTLIQNNKPNKNILIIVGKGNNGGDGLALARILFLNKIKCEIILLEEKIEQTDNQKGIKSGRTKENLLQLDIVKKLNIKTHYYNRDSLKELLKSSYLIVDAIFGIGLKREIEGEYLDLIEQINKSSLIKLALDIPSGIDSNNGKVLGNCIKADYTVTYGFNKIGLFMDQALDYVGKVNCVDIGIPNFYADNINTEIIDIDIIKNIYPNPRKKNSFKNKYGKCLFIGGSVNMSGAILLSAKSSLKSGLGLCAILTDKEIHNIVASQLPTAMVSYHNFKLTKDLKEFIDSFDCIVFGPGLGKNKEDTFYIDLLNYLINNYDKNLVIDADGLNMISNIELLINPKSKIVLTPHPGEFSRLINIESKEIQSDRIKYAQNFCKKYPLITLVLKGAKSIISYQDKIFINNTGNPILARGGTGDILSGIIGAFFSQGINAFDSATLANYIHGLTGDIALEENSENSIISEELINYIAKALNNIELQIKDIEKNSI